MRAILGMEDDAVRKTMNAQYLPRIYGIDSWEACDPSELRGKSIYQLTFSYEDGAEPHRMKYFVHEDVYNDCLEDGVFNVQKYCDKTQIRPPIEDDEAFHYNSLVTKYDVSEDADFQATKSLTEANTAYGKGGVEQIYIADPESEEAAGWLKRDTSFESPECVNTEVDKETMMRMNQEALYLDERAKYIDLRSEQNDMLENGVNVNNDEYTALCDKIAAQADTLEQFNNDNEGIEFNENPKYDMQMDRLENDYQALMNGEHIEHDEVYDRIRAERDTRESYNAGLEEIHNVNKGEGNEMTNVAESAPVGYQSGAMSKIAADAPDKKEANSMENVSQNIPNTENESQSMPNTEEAQKTESPAKNVDNEIMR